MRLYAFEPIPIQHLKSFSSSSSSFSSSFFSNFLFFYQAYSCRIITCKILTFHSKKPEGKRSWEPRDIGTVVSTFNRYEIDFSSTHAKKYFAYLIKQESFDLYSFFINSLLRSQFLMTTTA